VSATDLEIANEALRLCAGTTTTIILKALRLKANEWTPPDPDPAENLASWLLNSVVATKAAYAAEIREFMAKHAKDTLEPDADGWIKTPFGIDYVVNDERAIVGGRGVRGASEISEFRIR